MERQTIQRTEIEARHTLYWNTRIKPKYVDAKYQSHTFYKSDEGELPHRGDELDTNRNLMGNIDDWRPKDVKSNPIEVPEYSVMSDSTILVRRVIDYCRCGVGIREKHIIQNIHTGDIAVLGKICAKKFWLIDWVICSVCEEPFKRNVKKSKFNLCKSCGKCEHNKWSIECTKCRDYLTLDEINTFVVSDDIVDKKKKQIEKVKTKLINKINVENSEKVRIENLENIKRERWINFYQKMTFNKGKYSGSTYISIYNEKPKYVEYLYIKNYMNNFLDWIKNGIKYKVIRRWNFIDEEK